MHTCHACSATCSATSAVRPEICSIDAASAAARFCISSVSPTTRSSQTPPASTRAAKPLASSGAAPCCACSSSAKLRSSAAWSACIGVWSPWGADVSPSRRRSSCTSAIVSSGKSSYRRASLSLNIVHHGKGDAPGGGVFGCSMRQVWVCAAMRQARRSSAERGAGRVGPARLRPLRPPCAPQKRQQAAAASRGARFYTSHTHSRPTRSRSQSLLLLSRACPCACTARNELRLLVGRLEIHARLFAPSRTC